MTQSIDLAGPEKSDTVIVAAGDHQFRVINKVPGFVYTLQGSVIPKPVAPFDSAQHFKLLDTQELVARAVRCPLLTSVLADFKKTNEESQIPALIVRGNQALAAEHSKCAPEADSVSNLISDTWYVYPAVYTLDNAHYLLITVTRTSSDGKPPRIWKRLYSTGIAPGWRPTYGYVFPVLAGMKEFFAKQVVGKSDQFVITRGRTTKLLDAVPSVLFSFSSGEDRETERSWTAGFGIDPTNPFVSGGYGWTYHSNLHVGIGVAVRREPILLGKYKEGDTVATNLTASQLTSQEFRARPYVSLTLRFAKNPFGSGSAEASTKDKAPAKPQPTSAESTGGKPPT